MSPSQQAWTEAGSGWGRQSATPLDEIWMGEVEYEVKYRKNTKKLRYDNTNY